MEFKIQNSLIDTKDITRLYPIAIIKINQSQETTPISLEWFEQESKGRVDVAGFAIVVQYKDGGKKEFFYHTKDELDIAIKAISSCF